MRFKTRLSFLTTHQFYVLKVHNIKKNYIMHKNVTN